MNEPINIVLAGDRNVICGLEAVIYTTMLHNKNINWYILTMDVVVDTQDPEYVCRYIGLNDTDRDWFSYIVNYMDHNSTLTICNTRDIYDIHLSGSVNRRTGFTPYASLRLIIDVALPIQHCLYLDADVIVQDSIEDMYWKYLTKDTDYAAYSIPEACDGFGEMISAVLVMNVDRMRHSGFLVRARQNYNLYPYEYPDQMALALAGKPYPLPETYNCMHDHKKLTYKPTILHFSCKNYLKLYQSTQGDFYRYYPEHRYIKDGLDIIRETYR